MYRQHYLLPLLGLLLQLPSVATLDADETTPEELLIGKGLKPMGAWFALPAELDLTNKIRDAYRKEKAVLAAEGMVKWAEQAQARRKDNILRLMQRQRELRSMLENAVWVPINSPVLREYRDVTTQLNVLAASDKEDRDLKSAETRATQQREEYLEYLLDLRRQFDDLKRRYQDLGGDPEVRLAIEQYNRSRPSAVKLGPISSLLSSEAMLKKLEDKILTDSIPIRQGSGDLWYVSVMVNERHAQEMAIDTGASVVVLPWKTALAVGLKPTAQDPAVLAHLADGSVVRAKRVMVGQIRVGKFSADNVECTVMPEGLPQAQPLLGQSFLQRFNYQIQSGRGRLLMSGMKAADEGKPAGQERVRSPRKGR